MRVRPTPSLLVFLFSIGSLSASFYQTFVLVDLNLPETSHTQWLIDCMPALDQEKSVLAENTLVLNSEMEYGDEMPESYLGEDIRLLPESLEPTFTAPEKSAHEATTP